MLFIQEESRPLEAKSRRSLLTTRQLTLCGVLTAITLILSLTNLGYIPIPPLNATLMHVPTIIGGIVGGPVVGAVMGLLFGLSSLYNALTRPTLLSPLFYNPLVSILPRILVGLVSAWVYDGCKRLFKNRANPVSTGIAAALGTFTNSLGVLGMIYIVYAGRFAELMGIESAAVGLTLAGIGLTNGSAEAALAVIVTVAVVTSVNAGMKWRNKTRARRGAAK